MKGLCSAAVLTACLIASTTFADTPSKPKFGDWGVDLTGQDRAIRPGDNFFQYANGTFVKQLQIPPDRKIWGNFNILAELSQQRLKGILEELAAKKGAEDAPKTAALKAGAFYKSYMDEQRVEQLGVTPLRQDLALVRAMASKRDFASLIGTAAGSFQGTLMAASIAPDAKDPTRYAVYLGQAGLGLPDRDYYLLPAFADKKASYQRYIAQLLGFVDWPDAARAAERIVAFETDVARSSWTRSQSREDDKTYNPMSPDALKKAVPDFDWEAFLAAAKVNRQANIILQENSAVLRIAALAATTPIDTLRSWAAFHLVNRAARFLPARFVDASFQFNDKTLGGQPEISPRWKRGVEAADHVIGYAVGEVYVARYFPPSAKAKMDELTTALKAAFRARLQRLDWMSPVTKAEAFRKLDSFEFQVGYPKKSRNYDHYAVKPDDLYGNAERGLAYEWQYWLDHLGRTVDRDEWEMTPQTVNAYNEPVFNEVVFPAAILQPPFFDPHADDAVNFGGIGGVIGHEMTHSFDDQGRKHDAKGRLRDWWTAEDAARFTAKAKRFGAQFSAMEPLPGAHINGDLTMGENIADLGGLTLALDGYHASLKGKAAPILDGYRGDQRLLLGWAQVWRAKYREDALRQRLVVDPHSPPEARVNGPMRNLDAWYAAFDVKPGEKLYLKPGERVKIW